jgi:hypothetical protein
LESLNCRFLSRRYKIWTGEYYDNIMHTLGAGVLRAKKFYVLPPESVDVFGLGLETQSFVSVNSVWWCNWDGVCLLRGTDWVFVYNSVWWCNWDGVCSLRGTDWIFIYNSTFSPHSVFMCFVWIWEQTAIISLYNTNRLVFITETESVYCAVRTGYLYITLFNFSLHTTTQSRQSLIHSTTSVVPTVTYADQWYFRN